MITRLRRLRDAFLSPFRRSPTSAISGPDALEELKRDIELVSSGDLASLGTSDRSIIAIASDFSLVEALYSYLQTKNNPVALRGVRWHVDEQIAAIKETITALEDRKTLIDRIGFGAGLSVAAAGIVSAVPIVFGTMGAPQYIGLLLLALGALCIVLSTWYRDVARGKSRAAQRTLAALERLQAHMKGLS